jgi:hypothetical protein
MLFLLILIVYNRLQSLTTVCKLRHHCTCAYRGESAQRTRMSNLRSACERFCECL